MIDIHCHLIFGVDDGSRNLDESLKMVDMYLQSGFNGAILTSHYYRNKFIVDKSMVNAGLEKLREELDNRGIDFSIYPGNEVMVDDKILKDYDNDKISTLNNSRYILIEFPMLSKPLFAKDLIYGLQLRGLMPILAHPERYSYVQEDENFLLDFIKSGVLMQMNMESISCGGDIEKTVKKLLARNMIHIIGTDSHRSDWRNPILNNEVKILKDLLGEDRFDLLACANPNRIINNKFISSNFEDIIFLDVKPEKKWYEFWKWRG